jgi:hypothetical protein
VAADEEVGARLKLKDRQQFQSDARAARRSVEEIGDEADRAGRKAEKSRGGWLNLRGAFGAVRSGAMLTAGALGIVAAATVGGGIKMVSFASNANETASALTTVMGPAIADTRRELGELNTATGIPVATLENATMGFGAFGAQAGVSRKQLGLWATDLTKAGLDLSSFWNADTAETMQAIQSGLSGEVEPLRRFGIFMSDASLSAQALTMGLGDQFSELKEGEKVLVRQAFILKNLGAAQGDLARTADSPANAWRRFTGQLQQGATVIGQALLPAGGKLLGLMNDKLAPAIAYATDNAEEWGFKTEAAFVTAGREAKAMFEAFQTGGPDAVVTRLDEIAGGTGILTAAFDKGREVWRDVATIWSEGIQPALEELPGPLKAVANPLRLVDDVLSSTADHASLLSPLILGLVAGYTAWKVTTTALNTVQAVSAGIRFLNTAATSGLAAAQAGATTTTGALTVGTGALNAVMSANPIVLVVVALAALAAGVIYAYQHSETFRGIIDGAWQALQIAWDWILKVGGAFVQAFLDFTPLGQAIQNLPTILGLARDAFGWVVGKVKSLWEWLKKALDKAGDVVSAVGDAVSSIPGAGLVGKGLDLVGLADGGVVRHGGFAITGENGPELGYWPAGSAVLPSATVQALPTFTRDDDDDRPRGGDGGWPGRIEVPVILNGREIARAVKDDLSDEVARR